MTAIVGFNCRKLLSYSSASTTKSSLEPSLEFEFIFLTRPPTMRVGSKFECDNRDPIIDDVEVLPWVPLTAILVFFNAINSANISALLMTGIFLF